MCLDNGASFSHNRVSLAGTSNVVNINVGDPTPAITSISPNNWYAGTTTQFTINGSGFGTNPALTVTGNGIAKLCLAAVLLQALPRAGA